jgi:hypothetical protein
VRNSFFVFGSLVTLLFFGACRKDGAAREVEDSDFVQGRLMRPNDAAKIRALSLAARDELPSRAEVEAYTSGARAKSELLDDWSAQASHGERVGRVFGDLFGVSDSPFVIEESHVLVPNEDGLLESMNGTNRCQIDGAGEEGYESVAPWWLDGADTVRICRNVGCGPAALRCVPRTEGRKVLDAVRGELAARARYAYGANLDWNALWAGEWVYGNRFLAFVYQYEAKPFEPSPVRAVPDAAQTSVLVAAMRAVPLQTNVRFTLPSFLPPRAGIVTSPQFLKRHNNFRSRVRGLVQAMACEDVGPTLNTSGIARFVNADLSAFDKQHGVKAGCASCHFGMDNLGSALLGWSDVGHREFWKMPSQAAHAFGVDGEGPGFLMRTWVARGPGFQACMAKKAWHSFSGGRSFEALPKETRDALVASASGGLRPLVRAVLMAPELTSVDAP